MTSATRAIGIAAGAALIAAVALALALVTGSETIPIRTVLHALGGDGDPIARAIVLQLRLPRALAAFAAGGLLAVAGALMQALFRNPLADPYVLGLAGGAATGTLVTVSIGLEALLGVAAAWAGALLSVALVLWLGRREFSVRGSGAEADQPLRLLLIGIALSMGWGALITLILTLAPEASLRGMLFWLIGDLDGAESYGLALATLTLALALGVMFGRDLDVLLRGARWAATLGVRVERLRLGIVLLASAATAAAVTTVGTLGFIGLIVPNAVRLAIGTAHRLLLPVCALAGGALLVLADTLARALVAPLQLPVGAVIALAGVPAFIWLVARRGRRER